ncbi:MAG: potassium transporter Kup [Gemmatirosa sp.]|nr:potassium transporter Kup [Gemmatirosa sp.]
MTVQHAAPVVAAPVPVQSVHQHHDAHDRRYLLLLSLAALGIVYGDIGTSPLYSLREVFLPEHGLAPTPANVLGVLSLIVWSLVLVISVKYLVFILRADNAGEGGILALTSLVTPAHALRGGRWGLIILGLFGTSLLYGDGMITPAISVLSAVEGLEVVTPALSRFVVPITIVILALLFFVQSHGTAKVGRVFGPVMVLWFATLATLGIWHVASAPSVLLAIVPTHAVRFFVDNGWRGFVILGSVFLVVTGGEALYADMGHFGRRPIRWAWFGLVLPALLLNYFGQGALLIGDPTAVANPFFRMVPAWALLPAVLLATVATVIASQALISGAFSLTLQAVQLGYSPRVQIEHTSARERGQIYIPAVNWALMICCIGLVLGFRSSTNLAAAYGVAVTTTMAITTILFHFVARERWGWSTLAATALTGVFLAVDLAFLGANVLKIPHGGWFPLVVGALVFTLLTTWKKGRQILGARMREQSLPRALFLENMATHMPHRVPGTAVFMYGDLQGTPPALLHNLKHNKVLHARVVFLATITQEVPAVPPEERAHVESLGNGFWQVKLRYGFMEDADVPAALAMISHDGLSFRPLDTTYFLGRETLIATRRKGMALWRERLFALMARNARPATSFFRLPPNRVVELGAQVEL